MKERKRGLIWTNHGPDSASLYVNGIHFVTIRKKASGTFPFYFGRGKIRLLTYSGGFGSVETAKKHAEKRIAEFARTILDSK